MLILWSFLALAANPFEGRDTDVEADAFVAAAPETVSGWLTDLGNLEAALPCTSKWAHGASTSGVGARAVVTYDLGLMHRRLPVSVKAHDAGRRVDIDHEGNKGFVTRYTLTPEEGGTRVLMHTYIGEAPWGLRRYYFNRVQPAWQACNAAAVANVASALNGR